MKKLPSVVMVLFAIFGVLSATEICLADCGCASPVIASPAPAYTSYDSPVVSVPSYTTYYSAPPVYVPPPAYTAYYSAYSPVYPSYYNVARYTAAYPVYVNRPVYRTFYAAPVYVPARVYLP